MPNEQQQGMTMCDTMTLLAIASIALGLLLLAILVPYVDQHTHDDTGEAVWKETGSE